MARSARGWLAIVFMGMSMAAAQSQESLDQLWGALSAGDKSVLAAALKQPDAQMMTMKGSPNDSFWSALEKMGLMRQHPLPADMASKLEGTGLEPKIFSVTEKGHAELPAFLERVAKQ